MVERPALADGMMQTYFQYHIAPAAPGKNVGVSRTFGVAADQIYGNRFIDRFRHTSEKYPNNAIINPKKIKINWFKVKQNMLKIYENNGISI